MKKKIFALLTACLLLLSLAACGEEPAPAEPEVPEEPEETVLSLEGHSLQIYCGAGMTKPFQEIADSFAAETGCDMTNIIYANGGQTQSQIKTTEEGDYFIAGAATELEPVMDYVAGQKDLVKHIPVLAVPAGNPKGVTGLASLAEEGVTMLMGDPVATPIGKIAKKALSDAGIFDKITLAATTPTAPQMATSLAEGAADAAIVWKENCKVEGVEIVDTPDLDKYVKTIPAARLTCSDDAEAADAFLEFLGTDTAASIWEKYGYEVIG